MRHHYEMTQDSNKGNSHLTIFTQYHPVSIIRHLGDTRKISPHLNLMNAQEIARLTE